MNPTLPLNCIIVEDEILAQNHLQDLIEAHDALTHLATFDNIDDTRNFLRKHKVDIIFLDLEVSGRKTGIDLLYMQEDRSYSPAIFICSGQRDKIVEATDYNNIIINYLKKPFGKEKFDTALNKYIESLHFGNEMKEEKKEEIPAIKEKEYHFWYNYNHKSGGVDVKVFHKDIAYISVDGNYSTLVLLTGEMVLVQMSLKNIEEIIPSCFCYRISRDCLLCNPVCVKKYTRNDDALLLEDDKSVNVGDIYKRGLRAYVEAYG